MAAAQTKDSKKINIPGCREKNKEKNTKNEK